MTQKKRIEKLESEVLELKQTIYILLHTTRLPDGKILADFIKEEKIRLAEEKKISEEL